MYIATAYSYPATYTCDPLPCSYVHCRLYFCPTCGGTPHWMWIQLSSCQPSYHQHKGTTLELTDNLVDTAFIHFYTSDCYIISYLKINQFSNTTNRNCTWTLQEPVDSVVFRVCMSRVCPPACESQPRLTNCALWVGVGGGAIVCSWRFTHCMWIAYFTNHFPTHVCTYP